MCWFAIFSVIYQQQKVENLLGFCFHFFSISFFVLLSKNSASVLTEYNLLRTARRGLSTFIPEPTCHLIVIESFLKKTVLLFNTILLLQHRPKAMIRDNLVPLGIGYEFYLDSILPLRFIEILVARETLVYADKKNAQAQGF